MFSVDPYSLEEGALTQLFQIQPSSQVSDNPSSSCDQIIRELEGLLLSREDNEDLFIRIINITLHPVEDFSRYLTGNPVLFLSAYSYVTEDQLFRRFADAVHLLTPCQLKDILRQIVSSEPPDLIGERKLTMWNFVESKLTDDQKLPLASELAQFEDFDQWPAYFALVEDSSMQEIFGNTFKKEPRALENHRVFFHRLVTQYESTPSSIPFLLELFTLAGSDDWLIDIVYSSIDSFEDRVASQLFLHLGQDNRLEIIRKYSRKTTFLTRLIVQLFKDEQTPSERFLIAKTFATAAPNILIPHPALDWIRSAPAVIAYGHAANSIEQYRDQMTGRYADFFVSIFSQAGPEDQFYIIRELVKSETRCRILEDHAFAVTEPVREEPPFEPVDTVDQDIDFYDDEEDDDYGDEDEREVWTLGGFYEVYRDAVPEILSEMTSTPT